MKISGDELIRLVHDTQTHFSNQGNSSSIVNLTMNPTKTLMLLNRWNDVSSALHNMSFLEKITTGIRDLLSSHYPNLPLDKGTKLVGAKAASNEAAPFSQFWFNFCDKLEDINEKISLIANVLYKIMGRGDSASNASASSSSSSEGLYYIDENGKTITVSELNVEDFPNWVDSNSKNDAIAFQRNTTNTVITGRQVVNTVMSYMTKVENMVEEFEDFILNNKEKFPVESTLAGVSGDIPISESNEKLARANTSELMNLNFSQESQESQLYDNDNDNEFDSEFTIMGQLRLLNRYALLQSFNALNDLMEKLSKQYENDEALKEQLEEKKRMILDPRKKNKLKDLREHKFMTSENIKQQIEDEKARIAKMMQQGKERGSGNNKRKKGRKKLHKRKTKNKKRKIKKKHKSKKQKSKKQKSKKIRKSKKRKPKKRRKSKKKNK